MNNQKKISNTMLLILCLVQSLVLSQTHNIQFDNLSINEGLSQSSVRAILQDSHGFLWFGTQDGLNLYDGYDFKIFKTIKGDSSSISNNFIYDIKEDSDGFIWIGTKNGLNRFDHESNSIKRFSSSILSSMHNPSSTVISIVPYNNDQNKLIWFTTNDGVYKYNTMNDENMFYSFSVGSNNILSDTKIFLHKDHLENLWAFTNMSGIYKYNEQADKFEKVVVVNDRITKSLVQLSSVYEDSDGVFWFGSINGLISYNQFTDELKIFYEQFIYEIGERVSTGFINSIEEDNSGNLWLATSGYGLILFNKETEEVKVYQHDAINEKSISLNVAHKVYKDESGIIWVGTDGNGVDKMSPYLNNFNLVQNSNDGLTISSIRCFFEDHKGDIWISGYNGLDKLNIKTGEFTSYYSKNGSNQKISSVVYSFAKDSAQPDRFFYLGTEGDGIYRYDFFSGSFLKIYFSEISYGDNIILTMLDDGKYLWAGTNNGLIKINKATYGYKRFTSFNDDSTLINLPTVTSLFEDKKENFWIGTSQAGLFIMDKENEKIISFNSYYSKQNSIQNTINSDLLTNNFSVKCIQETENGDLWIGSTDGLRKLVDSNKTFINYTDSDGLPNNVIYGILEDNEGNLWMSTNFGICMFNPKTEEFVKYDYHDGLQSNEFNTNAYLKTSAGLFYFGGIKGYNYFDPTDLRINDLIPDVVFTDFYLFNQKIKRLETVNERVILKKSINALDTLTLQYHENVFSIYFAALDFSAPHKNLYSYRLDGFEEEFSAPTANRFVTYTNLNPGEYKLTVQGSNSSGFWNTEGKTLLIIIEPPFWHTWWFNLVVGSLIALILYSIYKYRINRILELERLRVKIASDLHDEVGSTLTKVSMRAQMLEMQVNDEKEASSLKRISEQAREAVSTMQDIVWAIDSRNDGLNNLIDKMKDIAFSVLTEKNIKVNFSVSGIDSDEKLNLETRQNLYLILKEAVHNIMKHSDASEVNISLTNTDKFLTMIIADNGKRYDKKEHHTGQGLRNIAMRAKKIKAVCEFKNDDGFIVIVQAPPIS